MPVPDNFHDADRIHETAEREAGGEATREFRIFGAPGTGKTTNIARQIRRAVDRYGPESVLVTSFSRTAAAELAGRDLPIPSEKIGTLHSHCYRALGAPKIAESCVDDWNRQNPRLALTAAKKHTRLSGEAAAAEEDGGLAKDGDPLLQQLSRYRGLMIPQKDWPLALRQFEAKWGRYKHALGLMDFTDLIERCLHDVPYAPKAPAVIFADEAQDLNRMQLTLIRKWGERANYFILGGDDDQCIYAFAGASPDAILDPEIPDSHKIILKQSYRLPASVHQVAESIIRQVTRRQEKIYLPRPEAGAVHRLSAGTYKSPEYFILRSLEEHLKQGKTVMFLAACSYMLHPVVAALRKRSIPFHNPYRKSNGFWNPLRSSGKGSSASRIIALLVAHPDFGGAHRAWTFGDLVLWADCLVSKQVLKHGMREKLRQYDQAHLVRKDQLDEVFESQALSSLMEAWDGDYRALLNWWRRLVTADFRGRIEFAANVAAAHGPRALTDPPKIVVGTIHSLKGAEADVVYLFPDLSNAGDAQYRRAGAARDSVIRLFYVGATRARETLYICQRATATAVTM
jgi:DNA helicase-2/ATP-dependent DNA helicase PcrA